MAKKSFVDYVWTNIWHGEKQKGLLIIFRRKKNISHGEKQKGLLILFRRKKNNDMAKKKRFVDYSVIFSGL